MSFNCRMQSYSNNGNIIETHPGTYSYIQKFTRVEIICDM